MPTPEVIASELQNLTRESLAGVGVFDTLMRATKLHLQDEYEAQRITGDEYATVYLGALNIVLQTSAQFLMNVQQTLLIEAQIDQIRASIDDTNNIITNRDAAQATHASKVAAEIIAMQAATANDNTRTANDTTKTTADVVALEANTDNTTRKITQEILLMAGQLSNDTTRTTNDTNKTAAEIDSLTSRTANETLKTAEDITASQSNTVNTTNKINAEIDLLTTQKANDTTRTINDTTRTTNETTKIEAEIVALNSRNVAEVDLLNQKVATELAQTADDIPAGVGQSPGAVAGVIGKQKTLYKAQSDGFARDAEQKLLKTILDTYAIEVSAGKRTPNVGGVNGMDDPSIKTIIDTMRTTAGIPVNPANP